MLEGKTEENMVNLITYGLGLSKIATILKNNTFLLKHLDDDRLAGGPVNGHYLKNFFTY